MNVFIDNVFVFVCFFSLITPEMIAWFLACYYRCTMVHTMIAYTHTNNNAQSRTNIYKNSFSIYFANVSCAGLSRRLLQLLSCSMQHLGLPMTSTEFTLEGDEEKWRGERLGGLSLLQPMMPAWYDERDSISCSHWNRFFWRQPRYWMKRRVRILLGLPEDLYVFWSVPLYRRIWASLWTRKLQ